MIDTVVSVKLPIGEMLRIKRNRLMPDVVLVALGEEVVVELHTLGVDLAGAVGEDAAPGDGETDAVDAELFAQLQQRRLVSGQSDSPGRRSLTLTSSASFSLFK